MANILGHFRELGEKITVKSALNPALWIFLISIIPVLLLSVVTVGTPPPWSVNLAFVGIAVAIFGYFFLLFFDRDKLQSESYQIKKQALELIEEKGQGFPIEATSIQAISNPNQPSQLPPPKDEQ